MTNDMQTEVTCPFCGEPVTLWIDVTGGRRQQYVEDCWVCCRPMLVDVTVHTSDDVDVQVRATDD
jgi:hypothetical protein